MIEQRYSLTADASLRVESLLARFERDRDQGPIEHLSDYAPGVDDPAYSAVVTELARVDLEHRFEEQGRGSASTYIEAYPVVFADGHCLLQIAYEEYRLRRLHGEDVLTTTVASKYGVDGARWTVLPLGDGEVVGATGIDGKASSRPYTPRQPRSENPVQYPSVGEAFAGYQLVAQLGEGAFSRVFLARQADLAERFVVLKVTPLGTKESDKLAKLQHSNIIPIYSVHRQNELSSICMPFLGATTFADVSACSERWASLDGPAQELVSTILARQQSTIELVAGSRDLQRTGDSARVDSVLESTDAENSSVALELKELSSLGYVDALVELVIGAVEGVAHAHRRGIIHRDLKPANILVTDEGCPVLLDFNLAIISDDADNRVVGGTLPYMSPEQLDSLRTGDPSVASDDVFAMGVILYELLSGQMPFSSPDSSDSFDLDQVIDDRQSEPRSLASLNSHVSPGLAAIVERCIAPQQADRYSDGTELLEDLRLHRQNLPLRHVPNRSIAERITKWTRRHPRLASASTVGASAVGILLVVASLWWQARIRGERLDVETHWQQFSAEFPAAIMALSSPGLEPEILSDGLRQSSELLREWDIDSDDWKQTSGAHRLSQTSQTQLSNQIADLLFLNAVTEFDLAVVRGDDLKDSQQRLENAMKMGRRAAWLDPSYQSLATHQEQRIANFGSERYPYDPNRRVFGWNTILKEGQSIASSKLSDPHELLQFSSVQLNREPTNAIYWFRYAVANQQLGNLTGSLSSFDVCDRLQPNSVATIFNRGLCHLNLGNHRQALVDFASCLELKPQLTIARFNHAVAAHRLGDHQAALADLNQIVAAGDPRTRMLFFRAEVHLALNDRASADRDQADARAIQPNDVKDYLSRGVSLLSESPKRAIADFEAALRLDRNNTGALLNLAHVYAELLDQSERAIEPLDRLAKIRPREAYPISSRGILRARLGQLENAIADAESASKLSLGAREQLQIAGIYAIVANDLPAENAGIDRTPSTIRKLAYTWLARAIESDGSMARLAESDQDLASLRESPQFKRLIGGASLIGKTAE
ncbi:MAG: serine/threonine-protein kinase [Pirellulaceae bacterium]